MKKLRVTVEGKVYEVLVEILDEGLPAVAPHAAAPVATLAPIVSSSVPTPISIPIAVPRGPAGAGAITCPLAGKLVSIDVKIGQAVEEGTQVAVIEAMKMNTYVFAPKAGTITEILVNPGDGVEEGATLIRMS